MITDYSSRLQWLNECLEADRLSGSPRFTKDDPAFRNWLYHFLAAQNSPEYLHYKHLAMKMLAGDKLALDEYLNNCQADDHAKNCLRQHIERLTKCNTL